LIKNQLLVYNYSITKTFLNKNKAQLTYLIKNNLNFNIWLKRKLHEL